jgi:tetratricopeptide (TPR) repeat protein
VIENNSSAIDHVAPDEGVAPDFNPAHPGDCRLSLRASEHLRHGLEQIALGEPAIAVAAFRSALQLAPHLPDAHVGLGVAYAMTSRIYPAIDHLERAAQLDPLGFHAHFKLAQLYFQLRVPAKGYEIARRALDCASTLDERRVVAQLLHQERQREHNGLARPWFYKSFSRSALWLSAAGAAALLFALLLHVH